MVTAWKEIQRIVYLAIYLENEDDLQVFGVHTCHDGECEFHNETHVYTEWGFKTADLPLIRSIRDGDEFKYYIAIHTNDPEE